MLEPIRFMVADHSTTNTQQENINKINEVIERVNLLQEYVTLEFTNGVPAELYDRLVYLRTELGVKI
jgi:hypothetical protein